jgi:PHP family Zn ribbon phosphoesterase
MDYNSDFFDEFEHGGLYLGLVEFGDGVYCNDSLFVISDTGEDYVDILANIVLKGKFKGLSLTGSYDLIPPEYVHKISTILNDPDVNKTVLKELWNFLEASDVPHATFSMITRRMDINITNALNEISKNPPENL